MKKVIPDWRDLLAGTGIVSILIGLWWIYPPLALIAGGLVAIWIGWSSIE